MYWSVAAEGLCVDVCSAADQEPHRVHLAVECSQVKGSTADVVLRIELGAKVNQQSGAFLIAVLLVNDN